ncbi:MAG TPA: hypothetical protein VF203_02640 [Burkholderiales bacterium]
MPRRARRLEGAALAALLALASASAAPAAVVVEVRNPRPFGHTVGDVLERVVTVDVPAGYALASASLPRAGRLDTLLEAYAPAVERRPRLDGARYTIRFAYQLVGSPETVTTLLLPAVTLAFENRGAREEAYIADWPVTAAPLAPVNVLARAGLDVMRPDLAPAAISTRGPALRLVAYALAAGLILLHLAYRRYGFALPGRPGPFARAYRELRAYAARDDAAAYRAMLRRLHRAFDETAGHSVFAGELEAFFAARPAFAGARRAIERFFAASRAEFFGDARGPAARIDPLALCRECRRRERGGR